MKKFFTKSIYTGMLLISSFASVYAASVSIDAPKRALSNRQPFVVSVYLNPEDNTISGISGSFSFPENLFVVDHISNENSIVPLWINQPAISEEKYFDNRVHINFEGIFPGGFDGVRSPYYKGKNKGSIFSVTLIPKDKGAAALLVDDLVVNAFTSDARPIPVESAVATIVVPELNDAIPTQPSALTRIKNQNLSAQITQDPLVNNNAWYVVVHDDNEKASIQKIQIAETDDYNGERVEEGSWRTVKMPYVLLYQDRSKFVNVKVTYTDNTYTTTTLAPVENSHSISTVSRILVSVIALLFALYFYGKSIIFIFFKIVKKK